MYTIDSYLTETESRAEHAYRSAYYAEYTRVFEPQYSGDRERLLFWASLAHQSAKAARERILGAAQPAYVQASRAELA